VYWFLVTFIIDTLYYIGYTTPIHWKLTKLADNSATKKTGGSDMKKYFKMFGVVGLLAGMMMVAGCGDDNAAKGRVVKGPVSGAKVTDSLGTVLTYSTTNGYFNLGGTAPYSSNGGQYYALNAAGTAYSVLTSAPPLTAPAGTTQLTPLSTAYENATAADKLVITDALKKAGLTLNSDLSVKTTANANAYILNETVGTYLATLVNTAGFAPTLAQMNAAAKALSAYIAKIPDLSTATAATIKAAVSSNAVSADVILVIGAVTGGTAIPATLTAAALTTASGAAADAANSVSTTTPPTPATPTGSTSGTGSTGTLLK
jgi:hypothetical protein